MIFVTIIIYNYNITIINNNDERLQDPILLLRITMGTRNYLFENYKEFGHGFSKRFASPVIV
jgi:hypothetical protein